MNLNMTKKEINSEIRKNEKRITRLEGMIEDIKFDIAATKKSIVFWQEQLKNAIDN